jgi:SAM-dependent methyltransferase
MPERPRRRGATRAIQGERRAIDGDVQRRAETLGTFVGARAASFEQDGRLIFMALVRRGLTPDSTVLDVGCGALRAGYWLIHFLEPDRYLGIDPSTKRLAAAREQLLEPGLEALKRPRFSDRSDFDLGAFGVTPRFVLMRSIWSHASKAQIGTMLDSFAVVAAPDSLLLTSYVPAVRGVRVRLALERVRRRIDAGLGRAPGPPTPRIAGDYRGRRWSEKVIGHDGRWVERACADRGLSVVESPDDRFGRQMWLEIRRAGPAPGLSAAEREARLEVPRKRFEKETRGGFR